MRPVCAFLLLFLVRSQSAPLATAARNSNSDTGEAVLGAVLGCLALLLLCAWLSGNIKCGEIRQILT